MGSNKKHKKRKKEKCNADKPPALKLILKVGNSSTPEHSDSPGPLIQTSSYTITPEDESLLLLPSSHKKSKKKKKKRERDHDKHERKKRHHHKERRKHTLDDSSQDNISLIEDSSTDVPLLLKDTGILHGCDSQSFDQSGIRESRLCVQLKQKQNRTPFQRLLDYVQLELEKKDVKQVFAWPVTDEIAPGYSLTISQPMDFSTMRQKIDDNCYQNLNSYISDLKLMCNNAMTYNHPETMYYKAAKRLLHVGLKFLSCEKLRQLALSIPVINQVPSEQLGFQLGVGNVPDEQESKVLEVPIEREKKECSKDSFSPKRKHCSLPLENKFEAIPDALSPEEILAIAQKAARMSAEKLALKRAKSNMGYLKQKPDGSTSLAIFSMGEKSNQTEVVEQQITLGQPSGKQSHGSGHFQGLQDRKNIPKSVKPMNYNGFNTSYAPSYDSTFANLTKEETELVYETYGDENAAIYAESILNFAKDCGYTLTMVDNLLDLLTGGEHRKAKLIIDEHKKYREEEERVKELMEVKNSCGSSSNSSKYELSNLKIEFDQLKSLSELGIDTSFLHAFEPVKDSSCLNEKIENSTTLIEKLQHSHDRLPVVPPPQTPPPPLLNQIMQPSHPDLHLTKISETLDDLEKQVPPGSIIPVPTLQKSMSMVPETTLVSTSTNTVLPIANAVDPPVVTLDDDSSAEEESCVGVGVDFESELREFLESDTALSGFPLHDDKTIEEMLSES